MKLTCTSGKRLLILCSALLLTIYSTAQNPIVTENALPGNPPSEWDIPTKDAGDPTIQGFATDISINAGDTVYFKIATTATDYTIDIYRLGYYNGDGARKMGTGVITAELPQIQPTPLQHVPTGLVDCGNWDVSAYWEIPSSAVSGVYIAKLTRTDNSGSSHIIFIVRNDNRHSDLFFQTSDATWQAYNEYGGNSLYVGATPSFPGGHAAKVSYNRPFTNRSLGGGGNPKEDWVFNAEYPMIRFLERNGYDVTYTTNVDAARHGELILNHKVFLSVGHDEYWSAEQRSNVEAARNAGIHLAFFSGNEVYWKTRWESSIDESNTDYRTLVCYKEGRSGELVCGQKCDTTTTVWTGLWRDGCSNPGTGGCLPENALTGQISWDGGTYSMHVPATYKNYRFWRNTQIANLNSESEAVFPMGTLGHEWDWEQYTNSYPNGRITLSRSTFNNRTHKLSLYKHASGAFVFGAGTVQWSWGLDSVHDRGNLPADVNMQQATVNLFADMSVQPETLQSNLVAASASTDVTAPVSLINSHTDGDTVASGQTVILSGTSSDVGGVIAGIEVSTDGGTTWKVANGTTSWNYSWTPAHGTSTIKVRGFDDSGNMENGVSISLHILSPECPCSFFAPTDVPQLTNSFENNGPEELGVKFRADTSGYILGLRFYKSTHDTGTHVFSLWTAAGVLLAQDTLTSAEEKESGWQEVLFDSPVFINADELYVASYNSPTGFYAQTPEYFTDSLVRGYLVAPANIEFINPNGLYKNTATPSMPDLGYQATNYWVDVVFNPSLDPDTVPPVVDDPFPNNSQNNVSVNNDVEAEFTELIDVSTISNSTFELRDSHGTLVPAAVDGVQDLAELDPVAPLEYSTTYTVTIKGGSSGVKDLAGNPLTQDFVWSFSTIDPPPIPLSEGPGGPVLIISSSFNPFSRFAVEIMRAEGLNEFTAEDISLVTPAMLNSHDVVILGEMTVTPSQASMLTTWVNAGGTLIVFKPSAELHSLLGITSAGGTLPEGYLLVNTASGPGTGIVGETMQYHGTADLYNLNGATSIATLYSDATTATTHPAVTTINVGSNGGKAMAFTYDLAKSIVYTRQGNPAWAGQKRDGTFGPIRSDDMFFGGVDPSWVDFNKIAIPQADEQQRLLVNMVLQGNAHKKPLPRFWFLPSGHKAAIVMTGDDHALNGTLSMLNHFKTLGPNSPQDVLDWKAIRATSYMYPLTPITPAQVAALQADGFEIALHVNTGCADFSSPFEYDNYVGTQFTQLKNFFPSITEIVTNRTHCITWSDWATVAKIQAQNGIRLDCNYYYWPESWTLNRPGLFTGSGMPMRFADLDGTIIDCYQVATQITDETNLTTPQYSTFIASLLDKALGAEAYYGVFCANMHTDYTDHPGANAVIAEAIARNVPVISAKQLLTWLDGRNNSSFGNIDWNSNQLSFELNTTAAARNLKAMVPFNAGTDQITAITMNGNPVTYTTETIKGIEYAFFDGAAGDYVVTYGIITTGTLNGSVTLQGRPAAPHARWVVDLKVDLYTPGNTTTPLYTYDVTTDQSGNFSIADIPVGTYTIAVKNSHTLKRVLSSQNIAIGVNTINFGILLEGDANNSNNVSLADFSILLNTFNIGVGNPGFDARADFNGDGFVSLADFSLLLNNFNTQGENP